jgi:radical SAM superfamily enzyme YgiQ (UPF0313 family)
VQAMTFTLPDAYLVARSIKRLSPETKVVLGGPHATIYPKETVALDAVDFAFAGEGEISFINFLNVFFDAGKKVIVPGVAGKIKDDIYYTPHSGFSQNMDSINYPSRKSSKIKRYSSVIARRNPITTMITSRGCPFECIFCNRMDRTYRMHSDQYVLNEIEDIMRLGIYEMFIQDDTFTLNRDRILSICRGIIDRKYDITWQARTRVDLVDEEMLSIMRRAGCYRMSFGVESGSEKVCKSIRKPIPRDRVINVFKMCRKEGIATLADFIFGNLDEEDEDVRKTLDFVSVIKPDYVQYSICSPYPATPLYEIGLKKGLISHDVWLEFANSPLKAFDSPVWTQHFSKIALEKITLDAYRAFYFRPSYIIKQLAKINSLEKLKLKVHAGIRMLK